MDQANTNCRELAARLDRLETNRKSTPDPLEKNESRVNNKSPRCKQAQHFYTEDTDAQYVKSVKLDAPSFDGCLDPQAFIDWTLVIDRYFR